MDNRDLPAPAPSAAGPVSKSPVIQEGLGRDLARLLRPYSPAVIAYWSSPEAAVLAHVVARILDADVISAHDDLGRLDLSEPVAPGTVVALVDREWDPYPGPAALARLLTRTGCTVVATAAVLHSTHEPPLGVPLLVLDDGVPS